MKIKMYTNWDDFLNAICDECDSHLSLIQQETVSWLDQDDALHSLPKSVETPQWLRLS